MQQFFTAIKRFNNERPLNLELMRKIEAFFDLKWNINPGVTDDEEAIMEQMPSQLQQEVIFFQHV